LATWILFALTCILALWSLSSRAADRLALFFIAVALTLSSGLRRDGYDYDNYLNMIANVRQSGLEDIDYDVRLLFGRDPMFISVVDLTTLFSDSANWPVFLVFSSIAVLTKYVAALSLPRFSTIFLAIYLIFISPTLEFSGIRAAAAIGIILLCVAYPLRLRIMLPLLIAAVASHISVFLSALVLLSPYYVRSRWGLVAFMAFVGILAYFSAGLLNEVQRGEAYIGKIGTIFAMVFPLIGVFLFFSHLWANRRANDKIYFVIAINLGLATGLALPSVGVSHRLLEIGLSLLLFAIIRDLANGSTKLNRPFVYLVMIIFLAFETFHHFYTGNWLAITIL
jgi:hypothetical protein